LTGTAILFLHDWRSVLALVHYETSPVGPYNELAVGALTGHGPSVVEMYVSSQAAMIGGRTGWGFPKQLRELDWEHQARRVAFQIDSRKWRVRASGPSFPVRAHLWTVQILNGRRVRVPIKIAGRARLAFQGRRFALLMESFEMTVAPPLPLD